MSGFVFSVVKHHFFRSFAQSLFDFGLLYFGGQRLDVALMFFTLSVVVLCWGHVASEAIRSFIPSEQEYSLRFSAFRLAPKALALGWPLLSVVSLSFFTTTRVLLGKTGWILSPFSANIEGEENFPFPKVQRWIRCGALSGGTN